MSEHRYGDGRSVDSTVATTIDSESGASGAETVCSVLSASSVGIAVPFVSCGCSARLASVLFSVAVGCGVAVGVGVQVELGVKVAVGVRVGGGLYSNHAQLAGPPYAPMSLRTVPCPGGRHPSL